MINKASVLVDPWEGFVMAMTNAQVGEFIQRHRCRVEWPTSGPQKGNCRLYIGTGKDAYPGTTLLLAAELANQFIVAALSNVSVMAGRDSVGRTKTTATTRRKAVATS